MKMEVIQFIPPDSKAPFDALEAAEDCAARAGVYRLLSGAFAEEPSREFLAGLRQPAALEALREMGLAFAADFTDTPLEELTETLACEYTTLFASPGGVPPLESARLTGRTQQEPYLAVQADYRRLGFEMQGGRFVIFEDHLGVELACLAALLARAEEAAKAGDEREFRHLDKEVKRFLSLHLGRWARGYARQVERATEHSFYREMAKLLGGFIASEIEHLRLKVEDADGTRPEEPETDEDGPVCGGAFHANPAPRSELPAALMMD